MAIDYLLASFIGRASADLSPLYVLINAEKF